MVEVYKINVVRGIDMVRPDFELDAVRVYTAATM